METNTREVSLVFRLQFKINVLGKLVTTTTDISSRLEEQQELWSDENRKATYEKGETCFYQNPTLRCYKTTKPKKTLKNEVK